MASNLDKESTNFSSINFYQDNEMQHLLDYHPFFKNNDFSTHGLVYFHNKVDSLYQTGPTCGLLTLLLANHLVKSNSDGIMNLDQLLERAKLLNLTKQGEMFSAKSVEILANQVLNLNAITKDDLDANQSSIIKDILNRKAILIPYDTDKNNEPCNRNGHKAHWCIAIGFCFKVRIDKLNEIAQEFDLISENTQSLINLKSLKPDCSIKLVDRILDEFAHSNLNLLCKQGKSKLLKLFPFNDLILSNKNLIEVGDQIDLNDYLVPEEGIEKTLSNKFVVISE